MLPDQVSRLSVYRNTSSGLAVYRMIFFLFAATVLIARVAAAPLTHDEYQFVASGQWLARALLIPYIDYPFLHMPYQVVVNGLTAALSSHDLLAARAANAVFQFTTLLLLYWLVSQSLPGGHPLAGAAASSLAVMILLFDRSLVSMDGRALNHALPAALSLAAFACFRQAQERSRPAGLLFISGLATGLAAGARLTYAVAAAPFLLFLFVGGLQKTLPQPGRRVFYFTAGLIAALLPVGLLVLAAPSSFLFGNYIYIRLNTLYRQEVGFEIGMNLPSKLEYFYTSVLANPLSMALYLLLAAVTVYALARFLRSCERRAGEAFLAALLAWAFLAASFSPTPPWPQYFFAPVPFLLLAVAYGLAWIPGRAAPACAAGIALLFLSAFPFASFAYSMAVLVRPERWVPVQVHRFSEALRAAVPEGSVLTLAPIFPLEAGLAAYPELTVGPFVWRTAPLLSAEGRRRFRLASFHELDEMLAQTPPAAILTGLENDYGFDRFDTRGLEQPLIDYALQNGFEPLHRFEPPFWDTPITLWIKPGG